MKIEKTILESMYRLRALIPSIENPDISDRTKKHILADTISDMTCSFSERYIKPDCNRLERQAVRWLNELCEGDYREVLKDMMFHLGCLDRELEYRFEDWMFSLIREKPIAYRDSNHADLWIRFLEEKNKG